LLTDKDVTTIRDKVGSLVARDDIEQMYFGGAIGADTVALEAALDLRKNKTPRLVAVVPNRINNQPKETQAALSRADEVIELGNPITSANGYKAYHLRNRAMVDMATDVVAFWSGDIHSGTYSTIKYANDNTKKVDAVVIEGKDKRYGYDKQT